MATWDYGEGEKRSCLIGIVSVLQDEKCSEHMFHNNMTIFNTAEPDT